MNFLNAQDEFRRGQDDFLQTANQPISVRHLSLPYNKWIYTPPPPPIYVVVMDLFSEPVNLLSNIPIRMYANAHENFVPPLYFPTLIFNIGFTYLWLYCNQV